MDKHSLQNFEEEPITPETIAAVPPSHRRYLSSPAAATIHGKRKVSCSGFLPRQSPCNIHAASTMRFAASRGKHASLYAHGHRTWQQSYSPYTAICNERFNKRIELCTHEQALIAEHRGGSDYARNDPNRNRRTHEVPFIAGCSHCTRKKNTVSCSGFLPKTKPMQHSCSHHNAFCSNTYTSMQPLQCVLQLHVTNPHYTAICNHRFKKRIALRTHEQPLIAEHGGGPIRVLLWDIKFHTTLQCDVLLCNVLLCDVLLCDVKSHTTLQCDVL